VLETKDYIDYYLTQKKDSPHDTSACFVVPKWRELPHPALSGMKILKEYRKGYHLYTKHGNTNTRLNRLPWSVAVYYDGPELKVPERSADTLIMQYKCQVQNSRASALIDTGAQGFAYISRKFCVTNNLQYQALPQTQNVTYGDGHTRVMHGP
jgi:hypothetical protein